MKTAGQWARAVTKSVLENKFGKRVRDSPSGCGGWCGLAQIDPPISAYSAASAGTVPFVWHEVIFQPGLTFDFVTALGMQVRLFIPAWKEQWSVVSGQWKIAGCNRLIWECY